MLQFVGNGLVNIVSSETPISDNFEGMCGNFGVTALQPKKKSSLAKRQGRVGASRTSEVTAE